MATTMVKETGARRPMPGDSLRFVAIRANLMPDEVIHARQADVMRKRVMVGLVALVLLLVLGYVGSWWQTSSARSDLDGLQQSGTALQNQQQQYQPLVTAQSNAQSIQTQLQRLMVGDLSWKQLLTTLRAQAPRGLALTAISGTVTAGAAGTDAGGTTAGGPSLNQTGKLQVGTITLSGTAPSKNAVAAYVDKLARVKGLTAPLITSVTTAGHTVTWSATAVITSDALGGRYAVADAATAQGGN